MQASSAATGLRARFAAWTVVVLALLVAAGAMLVPHPPLETDILALLPSDRSDPATDHALARFVDQIGSHVVFFVGSTDFDKARDGAHRLAETLQQSGAFRRVRWTVPADFLDKTRAVYAPYRDGLLADATRRELQAGDVARVVAQAQQALYTPAAFMRRSDPAHDPLNLFGAFLAQTTPAVTGALDLRDDVLTTQADGRHQVLVDAEIEGPAFAATASDRFAPIFATVRRQAVQSGLSLLSSGVILHAVAAAQEARSQLDRFGVVQALGMLLLLWWAFRSWRVPLLAVLTLVVAFAAAFVACAWAFGRVHVLTLVFGCNLAGVAVDYALYFCADQFRAPGRWRPVDALRQVGGAITLGMIASVLSYAVLATTPFPGLRQMALFCGVGLVVAWGCVLFWYPAVLRPAPAGVAERRAARFAALDVAWQRWVSRMPRAAWGLALVIVAAGTVVGLRCLHFQDDVRVLQDAPAALVHDDLAVGRLLGSDTDRRFFLVRGATAEAVLEHEEALRARLDAAEQHHVLGGYMAITQALPSTRRQAADRALLARTIYTGPDGPLGRFMTALGYNASQVRARLAAFSARGAPLTLAQWLPTVAAEPYRHLWLGSIGHDESASVVTLSAVQDAAALAKVADGLADVQLIDRVADVSHVLGVYRARTLALVALATLGSALLLGLYFRRRRDVALALVPAASVALTLALFGLGGVAVNLFHVVALLLVLGLGVDYAIFTQRGRAPQPSTLLSVTLAAAATLLAFGLLALSPTPFIHSLGLTVVVGVAVEYALCLVLGRMMPRPVEEPR